MRKAASDRSGWAGARQQVQRARSNGPLLVPGDVARCLVELGIVVERVTGDEAVAHCPGHLRLVGKVDRDPSWSVNLETGMHNCFSCGFRGPFVVIVREVLGLASNEADAWVRSRGSLERVEKLLTGDYIGDLARTQQKASITEADLALYQPPPDGVLATRGITAEAAAAYGVLYDPRKDCWITPIRDPATNALWGWQEKAVVDRYFRNRPRHVEKSRTLFGLDQSNPGRRAVLIESPLDACVVRSAGVPGALSSFGAGVSDAQMQIILERFDSLVLALDNDPDGRKHTERVYNDWHRRLPVLVMPYLTPVKDPGEMSDRLIAACLDAVRYPLPTPWMKTRRAHR
jgi:DNA primase